MGLTRQKTYSKVHAQGRPGTGKRVILLPVFLFCFFLSLTSSLAGTFTTAGSGNWNSGVNNAPFTPAATVPGSSDNVIVANTHTVTVTANQSCRTIVVQAGGTLIINTGCTLTANYGVIFGTGTSSNAGTISGAGNLTVTFGNSGGLGHNFNNTGTINITGTLTLGGGAGTITNTGPINAATLTYNASAAFNNNNPGAITISGTTTMFLGNLTNNASATFSTGTLTINTADFYNNSTLTVTNLDVSANGSSSIDNQNGSTLNISGTVTKGSGNFTVNYATNTVNYNGAGAQTVIGTTYSNLTCSNAGTKTLSAATTINKNLAISGSATLASDVYQITGNAAGTLTMAAGTALTLGNTGSATAVAFPTAFTNANTTLNATSTVTYQSTGAQTISSTPTYGGLTCQTSGTKTLAGAITVNGALAIAGTATLASDVFQITGNATYNLTMGAGTFLTLGNIGSATATAFPTNFTNAHCILNTTSTVVYQSTAAQTVSGVPTYGALTCQTSGTKTPGAAVTTTGDLIITGSATLASGGALTHTVGGITTISGSGIMNTDNAAGTFNLQALSMTGGSVAGSATGTVNVGTTFTVPSGSATIGQCTYSVTGATNITGATTFNVNTGVKTFTGLVTVNSGGGTWASTTVTTPGNMIFQNGITNTATFSGGGATFNTNNQSLNGTVSKSFNSQVIVTGVTVTNNYIVVMTDPPAGTLTGTGTWTQGANSRLFYRGSTMTITSLNASASGNIVEYDGLGAQTVFNPVSGIYYHLKIAASAGGPVKTLSANVDINGDLTIYETASFNVSTFDINLAGNWTNTSTHADPFVQLTRTVTFDGGATQTITNANDETFYNLVVSKAGGTLDQAAFTDITATNAMTLTDGVIVTGANLCSLTNTTASSLTYTNGFIYGSFRRFILAPVNTSTYVFTVGNGTAATDRHIISFVNNSISGVSYIITTVIDQVQGAANIDANLSTTQNLTQILSTSGEAASQTVIWNMTPDAVPGGGSYGVRLYVENTNLSAAQNDMFCPLKRTTPSATYAGFLTYDATTTIPAAGAAGRVYSAGAGYAQRTGYTTFSDYAIGVGQFPLPVEFLSFTATRNGKKVDLDWTTASEFNSDYFMVQRSGNGAVFEDVAPVTAAGNSSTVKYYSSMDEAPLSSGIGVGGEVYYRLKQLDLDGKFVYSAVVAVNMNSENELSVYPNPTSGAFNLTVPGASGEKVLLVIRDVLGNEFYSNVLILSGDNEIVAIDPSGKLAAGVYFVVASMKDRLYNNRIVVR